MRCKKCIAVTLLAISAVTTTGISWKGQPMRVILIHAHRVAVYDTITDSQEESIGEVAEGDQVDA